MNPLLEAAGQTAAIIICLFVFVFVILAVAFNLAMAFGMSWVSEKINLIKMLRPTVNSVNKASESAMQGVPLDQNQNAIIRTAASIPARMHTIEKKVDQGTDKVADAVIEFHARTVQVKTIFKAFFLPGLAQKKQEASTDEANLEFNSPGYRMLMKERPEAIPTESMPQNGHIEPEHNRPVEQVQHAAYR
jgi:hypothetical protein